MMMMMLSDEAFWLDHNQIEDSEVGCILLPAWETIHIITYQFWLQGCTTYKSFSPKGYLFMAKMVMVVVSTIAIHKTMSVMQLT